MTGSSISVKHVRERYRRSFLQAVIRLYCTFHCEISLHQCGITCFSHSQSNTTVCTVLIHIHLLFVSFICRSAPAGYPLRPHLAAYLSSVGPPHYVCHFSTVLVAIHEIGSTSRHAPSAPGIRPHPAYVWVSCSPSPFPPDRGQTSQWTSSRGSRLPREIPSC